MSASDSTVDSYVAFSPSPGKALSLTSGDFTWRFGGYVKVDVIHDFDEIGSEDSFDPRTIPTGVDTGTDDSTRIHARQTRFNVDVQGPSDVGPARAFVEGDFFGDGNAFRMRHAFGSIGSVLGGQTWSTFMDEDAMPETLDFESPVAFPIVRQAQVRWTRPLNDAGDYFALAIEDPDSEVLPPTGVAGQSEEPLPDLTARVRWNNSRGHVQLGAFGGMARFDPDAGTSEDVGLWGVNLAVTERVFGDDNAIAQVTCGEGVGRYRGGAAAAPDASGDLEAIGLWACLVSYQHRWSAKYRSTLAYSFGEADVPDGAPPEANEALDYLAANVIWQFSKRAWAGVEYLYGSRETFDDEDGHANRLQFAIRFDI